MNSFDLFDTLVARRCVTPFVQGNPTNPIEWQMEREARELIPIAENIARVRPGDVIVSDMYLPQNFLKEQVERVTGLTNEVYVSTDGKATGRVWKIYRPDLHLGDNFHTDIAPAKAAGVAAELTSVAGWSNQEKKFHDAGFPGLARLMREARLGTWHSTLSLRSLQLHQTQYNLPWLFLASILLHRRLEKFDQVLMSSRDCWLWLQLFRALTPLLGGKYEITYFLTSRLTRYWPSANYRDYVSRLLAKKSLIVDLCGFGTSLRALAPNTPALVLVGFRPCVVESLTILPTMNEIPNFARHPMVGDVDATGTAVYVNPTNVDWENMPELHVMHEAFLYAVKAIPNHDFTLDFSQNSNQVRNLLEWLPSLGEYAAVFQGLESFRLSEAKAAGDLINSRGRLLKKLVI